MLTLALGRRVFHGVAFSQDDRSLVTVNSGSDIRVWDRATWETVAAFPLPDWSFAWAGPVHSWGGTFALAGTLLPFHGGVWDLGPALAPAPADPPCRKLDQGVPPYVTPVAVATAGRVVAGVTHRAGALQRVRVWDLDGRQRAEFDPAGDVQRWGGVALSPDARLLAVPAHPKTILLLDLAAKEQVGRLDHTDWVNAMTFSPDGRHLLSVAGRSVWLWDVVDRKLVRRFRAFARYAAAPAFHPGGHLVGAGSRERLVRLWRVADGSEVARLDWGVGAIHGLAFSPDGLTAAAAGRGKVVVWDLE